MAQEWEAMSNMATIRVPITTLDRLARLAEMRGITIEKLLDDFAKREYLHQTFADERLSWGKALENPAFVAELDAWDA